MNELRLELCFLRVGERAGGGGGGGGGNSAQDAFMISTLHLSALLLPTAGSCPPSTLP